MNYVWQCIVSALLWIGLMIWVVLLVFYDLQGQKRAILLYCLIGAVLIVVPVQYLIVSIFKAYLEELQEEETNKASQ